jgi:hypothetical protein
MRARLTACLVAATALLTAGDAAAAAPAPCNNTPQITDSAAATDGHHPSSNVTGAWVSEASGHPQAVIRVLDSGAWKPAHLDATPPVAGFAFLFTLGSQTDYVRAQADEQGSLTYDYGTYSGVGAFHPLGRTTGAVDGVPVNGTVTIDIPAALGATPGAVIANPFVLTYDGFIPSGPDWVDHAPGATLPNDPARGADYRVGSCTALGGGAGVGPGAGGAGGAGAALTSAVQLSAPKSLRGGGVATVRGRVVPAQGGVDVAITRTARGSTAISHVATNPDGRFKLAVAVRETSRLRAKADGIGSDTLTVTVRSKVRIKRHGRRITGTVAPRLPGRVLLLPRNSPTVVARRAVEGGRFSFRIPRRHGRFQVVYVPAASRAERSTSNTINVT